MRDLPSGHRAADLCLAAASLEVPDVIVRAAELYVSERAAGPDVIERAAEYDVIERAVAARPRA